MAELELDRARILAFRRSAASLDERLPAGERSLRRAAWAGLQDSMPRAALLSIHARVRDTQPDTWEHPSLVQVWGPRFSVYVVAARDRALFTLARLPDDPQARRRAEDLAARLREVLGESRIAHGEAGRALGEPPNRLRYATTTGTVLLRWEGARQPVIWVVDRPDVTPEKARRELARRFLHVFGPATAGDFATWAGIKKPRGVATFERLRRSLAPVRTAVGPAWILARDEERFRAGPEAVAPARLLPSGDAFYLLQGAQRELLVPDPDRRSRLWTSRVWPGAVLVEGEVVGTWRRAGHVVTIDAWRQLSASASTAVETEATDLPLPGLARAIDVRWGS